jgi:UDP-GlcNAc3NAcA epimerase
MKIATIVGARPQFIKAAVVARAFRATRELHEVMIHTGQHYDQNMSEVFFRELGVKRPDYNLGIGSGLHGLQTGRMLEALEGALLEETPDWVLVYGDTNSTLAGALAAAKLRMRVVHVEAGLRSFERRMPEEINRLIADQCSDLLFVPTKTALHNLRREGVPDCRIHLVGDVMYDAAVYYGPKAEVESRILEKLGVASKEYILATLHRAENTDNTECLRIILGALTQIARDLPVVLPIHPRTRKILTQKGLVSEISRHIRLIEPLGYLDMIMLGKNARLIATDSGGVQKEAYFHRVPCVTFRQETEWVELLELGWNRLARPTDIASVISGLRDALDSTPVFSGQNLYGDGHAAERIANILLADGRRVAAAS